MSAEDKPEAGPSRLRPSVAPATPVTPAAPSTPALTPDYLAAKASESHNGSLPESTSSSSAQGWLKFLVLLRELSDTQRLSFTAEVLALENYLTTRLRYELAELNELVSLANTETFIAHEAYKTNDVAIEQAANELMKGIELDGVVEAASDIKLEDPPKAKSRVVHVNGLPFLLYVPSGFTSDKDNAKRFEMYKSRRRHEAQLNILRTMLLALRTFTPVQPVASAAANLPRLEIPHVVPARGVRPAAAPPHLAGIVQPPIAANGAAGQRAGYAIVVNVDEVARMFVPLFFLSLKLAFLLWIFGKHASPKKRMFMMLMAFSWVVYEAWSMRNRRATELRRQREREREEIARALRRRRGEVTPALNTPDQPQLGADAPAAAEPAEGRRRHHHHHHRSRHASTLTPKYWINAIASVGLAAEAREMGLVRHATRPHERLPAEAPPTTVKGRAKRAFRRFIIGLVLFVGTLIPDVEKRRKRLLEKRERVRSQIETDRLAQQAAAQGIRTAGAPVAAEPSPHVAPTLASSIGSAQTMQSSSDALTDSVPTLASNEVEPPPPSPVPPAADDISLLASPTPELQTDEEDERAEGDVDEVGMILF